MASRLHLGMNKTGIQMSPRLSKEMQEVPEDLQPAAVELNPLKAEQEGLSAGRVVRLLYSERSTEGVGSIPIPGTVRGMISAGADAITGDRASVLVDKMAERLSFERGGVRLYDLLITKAMAARLEEGGSDSLPIDLLEQFRHEEWQHAHLLHDAMTSMGADPTAQPPCADVVGVANMGLMQNLSDPRVSFDQGLQMILIAELADQDGWELLIELTEEMGHSALADKFRDALVQENIHLENIRALFHERMIRASKLFSQKPLSIVPPAPATSSS